MRAEQAAEAARKAETLIESLPWLERFRGAIIVVKYGGNAMVSAERAHGRPTTVTASRTAATSQPAAIQMPPATIQTTFSRRRRSDKATPRRTGSWTGMTCGRAAS